MAWNSGLTRLQEILSDLYPTAGRSTEIVEKAQLPTGRINFDCASLDRWRNVLEEADKHEKVLAIIAVAREEYKAQAEDLTQAEQEYLHGLEKNDDEYKPAPDSRRRPNEVGDSSIDNALELIRELRKKYGDGNVPPNELYRAVTTLLNRGSFLIPAQECPDLPSRLWKVKLTEDILDDCTREAMRWEAAEHSQYEKLRKAVGSYVIRLNPLVFEGLRLAEIDFWVSEEQFKAQLAEKKERPRNHEEPEWGKADKKRKKAADLVKQMERELGWRPPPLDIDPSGQPGRLRRVDDPWLDNVTEGLGELRDEYGDRNPPPDKLIKLVSILWSRPAFQGEVKDCKDLRARLWNARLAEQILADCIGEARKWDEPERSQYFSLLKAVGQYVTKIDKLAFGGLNLTEYDFWVPWEQFGSELPTEIKRPDADPAWEEAETARQRIFDMTAQLEATLGLSQVQPAGTATDAATRSGAPATGFSSAEQREMLEQQLARHQRNLAHLRDKKAVYAAGEEPLYLRNQIDHEEQEISRIHEDLAGLP